MYKDINKKSITIYIYDYKYVNIYIYVYICAYVHTYMHTYMHLGSWIFCVGSHLYYSIGS